MSTSNKRVRLATDSSSYSKTPPEFAATDSSLSSSSQSHNSVAPSSFRNVSACHRCRTRKNRCDQNLPACASCDKAGVKCVGFDPITNREIPRTYVYYLESRVNYLESLLLENDIPFGAAQDFDLGTKAQGEPVFNPSPLSERSSTKTHAGLARDRGADGIPRSNDAAWEKQEDAENLNKLVSNIGMVSVHGTSDKRYLGSTSGISFARVVFAAIKSSVPGSSADKGKPRTVKALPAPSLGRPSMRDSFFGLQSKPTIKQAPFPDRELGQRLVNLYFEYANPQIPILHRGEFMTMFDRAYASKDRQKSPRELYMLNIVFALGAGIIFKDPKSNVSTESMGTSPPMQRDSGSPNSRRSKLAGIYGQPEEYHASAMMHLESFLGSTPASGPQEGFGGALEELQAVLLLASFALLRPVAPGLWYITGVAVRLGVDLGLHYEDGSTLDPSAQENGKPIDAKERGRREWVRDLRRRLWWCVYTFDRLVSTCVGRPFGITDQVITTDFPSILPDEYISAEGFATPSEGFRGPSYKRVSHHYFRLRLLQSEILQVLQYRQAQKAHENDKSRSNKYMHTKLSSSFLQPFESFKSWRRDIDRRLWEWKESAPNQDDTTVQFSVQFLELNYWQAVIMLYRQSLSVPPSLAGEASPSDDVASSLALTTSTDEHEDEDEIFLKVAEAGQCVLKLYRQLHSVHLVNYTYLATVHLFMAGIAFLYAIWHSATVRSRLTLEDVNFTVLAGTSVLEDLMSKCPPAEACRDAFDRMSKATVQMCVSTSGFASQVPGLEDGQGQSQITLPARSDGMDYSTPQSVPTNARPPPQFDMNLQDLFPDDLRDIRFYEGRPGQWPPFSRQQVVTSAPPVQSFGYQPVSDAAVTEQDFNNAIHTNPHLDTSMTGNASFDDYALSQASGSEFDFLMMDDIPNTAPYHGNSGLALGFEANHDWSDGAQVDLFDGFFFGGAPNGMGGVSGV